MRHISFSFSGNGLVPVRWDEMVSDRGLILGVALGKLGATPEFIGGHASLLPDNGNGFYRSLSEFVFQISVLF